MLLQKVKPITKIYLCKSLDYPINSFLSEFQVLKFDQIFKYKLLILLLLLLLDHYFHKNQYVSKYIAMIITLGIIMTRLDYYLLHEPNCSTFVNSKILVL